MMDTSPLDNSGLRRRRSNSVEKNKRNKKMASSLATAGGSRNTVDRNTNNNSSVQQNDDIPPKKEKKKMLEYEYHTTDEYFDVPKSQVTVSMIWKGLKAHTTSHGIPHVDNARGGIKRTFWTLITLTMIAVLIFNLYQLIDTYLKFNVDVIIKMEHQRALPFPAITICNMNPVKRSMVSAVPELEQLIYHTSYTDLEGQPIDGSAFYPNRTYPRETFIKEEKMAEYLADIDLVTKRAIGYQPYEMFIDCQYAGADCFWQEFEFFYNSIMGNCYVFNSGWNNQSLKMSHKTGRRYGLKLVVNIDQDEYLPDVGESAGIRVVVHPQERMPFPQDEGVLVGPGMLTSLGIRQVTVSRQGQQYGNCTHVSATEGVDYVKNATRNVFEEYYNVKYTASACYKTCYQRYLIQLCGCGDAQFPLEGEAFAEVSKDALIEACHSADIVQDDCKYNITDMFNTEKLTCDECVLPCYEISYQPEISTSDWPSDVYEQKMLEKFSSQITGLTDDATDPEKYKRNLLKIEIYYEEFNYENIAERPSYLWSQFASDIGGVIGLYLGWSMLTVFEFFEFGLDLCMLGINKKKKPPPVNPSDDDNRTDDNGNLPNNHHDHHGGGGHPPPQAMDVKQTPPPAYTSLKFV